MIHLILWDHSRGPGIEASSVILDQAKYCKIVKYYKVERCAVKISQIYNLKGKVLCSQTLSCKECQQAKNSKRKFVSLPTIEQATLGFPVGHLDHLAIEIVVYDWAYCPTYKKM